MKVRAYAKTVGIASAACLLGACATQPEVLSNEFRPISPILPAAIDGEPGTIYDSYNRFTLFADQRARNIGDILTIELVEQTQASKSASTGTSRTAAVDTGNPVVLGRTITQDGLPVLSSSVDANQSFEGAGSSSQSNQLLGDITVTVADVLANGNLVVRGEKWLTLNQGEEYIQVSGIVRPSDIRPDNSVESLRLADARIAYSGQGHVANSNRPGWLSRFFTSVIWPF